MEQELKSPQLAVVIMAWDEGEVLARCLDSLAPLGDAAEIIVSIDDRTQDDSAEIASRYTEHVISHQGIPDHPVQEQPGMKSVHSSNSMSRMRNDVLEQACQRSQAPYLLWLDADEWIESGHAELLEALEHAGEKQLDGMMVQMVDVTDGSAPTVGAAWRQWGNCKVVRRDLRFERRRHEGVFAAAKRLEIPLVIHHCKLEHEGHRDRRMAQKLNEMAFMLDWREFGDGRAAYYMGDCLNARGAFDHAVLWFEKSFGMYQVQDPQRLLPGMKLVGALFALGRGEEARRYAFECLRTDWRRGDMLFDLSQIAASVGQTAEAEQWLRMAATYEGRVAGVSEIPTEKLEDLPPMLLSRAALARGDFDEAREWLQKAQAFGRNRPEFHDIALAIDQQVAAVEPLPRSREGLIVLSGGMRTGTTWFCETLNRLGRFVDEPFILGERKWYASQGNAVEREPECSEGFAERCSALLPDLRPRRGGFDEEETAALVALYREFVAEWPEAIGYKDALPQISAEAFPGSQIIILERSTASVLASISKRWGPGPNVAAIGEVDPTWWEHLLGEEYKELDPDSIEARRWEQAAYNVMLQRVDEDALEAVGADYRIVQFEELTANYQHVVPELLDWLGYEVGPAYDRLRSALHAPVNRPPQDLEERRLFARIASAVEGRAAEIG